jgi:hypothetical protein
MYRIVQAYTLLHVLIKLYKDAQVFKLSKYFSNAYVVPLQRVVHSDLERQVP